MTIDQSKSSQKLRRFGVAVAFVCFASMFGCGKTSNQFKDQNLKTIEKHRPKFDALREDLKAIAAKLPKAGAAMASSGKKDIEPKPLLNTEEGPTNAEIFTDTQLLNPDPREHRAFPLPGKLLTCYEMLRTKLPFRNDMDMEAWFADALKVRYIVVIREVQGAYIEIMPGGRENRRTYNSDSSVSEGFLVDLSTKEILAATRVIVTANELYVTSKGREASVEAAGQATIDRDLRSKTRARNLEDFNRLTNGSFH